MKKILAAAGIGAAIAIGSLAGAGTANANENDFVSELRSEGFVSDGDASAELQLGHQVCDWVWFGSGYQTDLAIKIAHDYSMSFGDANTFVSIARRTLC